MRAAFLATEASASSPRTRRGFTVRPPVGRRDPRNPPCSSASRSGANRPYAVARSARSVATSHSTPGRSDGAAASRNSSRNASCTSRSRASPMRSVRFLTSSRSSACAPLREGALEDLEHGPEPARRDPQVVQVLDVVGPAHARDLLDELVRAHGKHATRGVSERLVGIDRDRPGLGHRPVTAALRSGRASRPRECPRDRPRAACRGAASRPR